MADHWVGKVLDPYQQNFPQNTFLQFFAYEAETDDFFYNFKDFNFFLLILENFKC